MYGGVLHVYGSVLLLCVNKLTNMSELKVIAQSRKKFPPSLRSEVIKLVLYGARCCAGGVLS